MNGEMARILRRVEKPARYVDGEWNVIRKDWGGVRVRMAFCFPDVYEVGMSHLGLQILYHVANGRPDTLMERSFAPWPDMERELRAAGLRLYALESRRPLRDFDIVAFTLQYELTYTNLVNMLALGGIPPLARERGEDAPLVLAGGPCAFNPEPLADFVDCFVLGEGEEVLHEILDLYAAGRERGWGKARLLLELARSVPGVYVPGLYRVEYGAGGVEAVRPTAPGIPERVVRRVLKDLEGAPYPLRPLVPNLTPVHDRIVLEIFRGCTRGCRFCQAGFTYRPVRERGPAVLVAQAEALVRHTGHEEISLASLSSADYSHIVPLVGELGARYGPARINVSLPSLRVDSFSVELARAAQGVRRTTLTFAPEAGTQRLRDAINKGVTEEDLVAAVDAAFASGWTAVKLYFMIGLPTETTEDLDGIVDLARTVLERGRRAGVPPGRLRVTVSVSSFVPKPHTPFQWEPQEPLEVLREKQDYLRRRLRDRRIEFHWHDAEMSFLEAVLARGDRRLGRVIYGAWRAGCRFDGWREHFRPDLWRRAFAEAGLSPEAYAHRRYAHGEVLPWDHLDTGVSRRYLEREHERALAGRTTVDCRFEDCTGCGLCPALGLRVALAGGNPPAVGERRTAPPGNGPVLRYRLRLTKGGPAAYLGHLDFARVVAQAARRAGLPLAYSRGFNPRPRLAFAAPLAVGITSEAEYCDLELEGPAAPEGLAAALNANLPEGIAVTAAGVVPGNGPSPMGLAVRALYRAVPPEDAPWPPEALEDAVRRLLAAEEVKVVRAGKKGPREV
ncbi:MAG: TIGR03960 family B12-binding radical SAM protein, partial [Firmicutes bacterium]|nr:TIGR03960 family B12-binding radical SAM protein [Bacillota bacterium]